MNDPGQRVPTRDDLLELGLPFPDALAAFAAGVLLLYERELGGELFLPVDELYELCQLTMRTATASEFDPPIGFVAYDLAALLSCWSDESPPLHAVSVLDDARLAAGAISRAAALFDDRASRLPVSVETIRKGRAAPPSEAIETLAEALSAEVLPRASRHFAADLVRLFRQVSDHPRHDAVGPLVILLFPLLFEPVDD